MDMTQLIRPPGATAAQGGQPFAPSPDFQPGLELLSLDIPDEELNRRLNKRIEDSRTYLSGTLKWWEKMEQAEKIWWGDQVNEDELYEFEKPAYVNNLIFRSVETIIPIAVSRIGVPEAIAAQPTERSKKLALDLESHLQYRFRYLRMRSKIRMALRHLLLYRVGVIKWLWDYSLPYGGDYVFKVIRPTRLYAFDTTHANPDEMDFITEVVTEPVRVVVYKFPQAKDRLYERLGIQGESDPKLDEEITYEENWIAYYTVENEQLKRNIGLVWRYKGEVIGKIKNPNWDWQGEDREIVDEFGNPTQQKVFHNFFDHQKFPYVFLNFLNLGKSIIDETSLVEQAWPLQQAHNKRVAQLDAIAEMAPGKMVFSTRGMEEEEQEKVTWDRDEHITVGDADVREAFAHVPGPQISPALFEDIVRTENAVDNIAGTHSTTRGERKEQETLGGRMMLREADYGRVDDLIQEAVEPAIVELFQAAAHLIKLRYTEAHFAKISGKDGRFDLIEFTRDSVEDGMEIDVQEGSTLPVDNLSKRAEAISLAQLPGRITDDDLYMALGWDNPKESAAKLAVFNSDKGMYARILASGQSFLEFLNAQAQQPAVPAAPGQPTQPGQPAAVPAEGGISDQQAEAMRSKVERIGMRLQGSEFDRLPDEQKARVIEESRAAMDQVRNLAGEE